VGVAVMGAAPGVTPCRCHTGQVGTGATVRDTGWYDGRCGAAARADGDAGSREQITVPPQPAVRAGEDPPGGLGNRPGTCWAGGGGAPLIDQPHADPGHLGLVPQGPEEVADPPGAGALVVPPPRRQHQHTARIADRKGADAVLDGPGDHLPGGLMLGLADAAAVPRLDHPSAATVAAPPPGPVLPGPGRPPRHGPLPGLGVPQVLVAFGADGPTRHQQALPARPRHRIRVNDPHIHPGDLARVRLLPGGQAATGTSAVTSTHSRPASASNVTDRT